MSTVKEEAHDPHSAENQSSGLTRLKQKQRCVVKVEPPLTVQRDECKVKQVVKQESAQASSSSVVKQEHVRKAEDNELPVPIKDEWSLGILLLSI